MDAIRNHLGAGGLDLAALLVRKNGWRRAFADAAVEEYARFCWLAAHTGHPVAPSEEVDEVWHLHLQHTRDYWETFCPKVLGTPLHHEPGTPNPRHRQRLRDDYAETLASYQRAFGPPPEAFWPTLAQRFDAPRRFRLVDTHAWRIEPLRQAPAPRRRRSGAALALLIGLGLVPVALALPASPLDWDGPTFLRLFTGLSIVSIAIALVAYRRLQAGDERAAGPTPTPTPFELAYLGGGPSRVLDAAVMDLMGRRVVRWNQAGDGLVVEPRTGTLPPVLDAVAQRIRRTPKISTLARSTAEIAAPIRATLSDRGLLAANRLLSPQALLPMLPIAATWLLGAAKIHVGVDRGRPVEYLAALMVVLTILAVLILVFRPKRSAAASRLLESEKARNAAAIRAPRAQDMAIAVALGGTAVLVGTAYADWHQTRSLLGSGSGSDGGGTWGGSDSSTSGSSGDSGSSDSGGGSDGGSSCSSGCGGCGGGGGGGD